METTDRDPQLWRQAKAQAKFKAHAFTYLWVNALLWTIWALTSRHQFYPVPWPVWATFFWGIGLFSQGVATYTGWRGNTAEREYQRLVRQKEGR